HHAIRVAQIPLLVMHDPSPFTHTRTRDYYLGIRLSIDPLRVLSSLRYLETRKIKYVVASGNVFRHLRVEILRVLFIDVRHLYSKRRIKKYRDPLHLSRFDELIELIEHYLRALDRERGNNEGSSALLRVENDPFKL